MKHVIVYSDPTMYAGWPANHGAWQWGDEFLVGFLRGRYSPDAAMHPIEEPYEHVQARSLDEGVTWRVEQIWIPDLIAHIQVDRAPVFSLSKDIIRVRGNYDHGGDFVPHATRDTIGLGRMPSPV